MSPCIIEKTVTTIECADIKIDPMSFSLSDTHRGFCVLIDFFFGQFLSHFLVCVVYNLKSGIG